MSRDNMVKRASTASRALILDLPKSFQTYSLRKHPFLLALRRWGRFARRNVPSGEERGETDVFVGYQT